MRQPAILKAKTDHVDELINYVSEVKPFHTKIIDSIITYRFSDDVNIKVTDDFVTTVDFFFDESTRNKHGFEKYGYGITGLDQYPGQPEISQLKRSRYGYDKSKYDATRYDLTDTANDDVYSLDQGIDDFPLDFTALDERYDYSGFDEVPFETTALDYDLYFDMGLDEAPFDINSFDFINEEKNIPWDPFIDVHFNVEDEFDDYEGSSPTTIKTTITEQIIIDKSRQVPAGFDYVGFSVDKFDTVPNEFVGYSVVGYDVVNTIEKYDTHPYESTVRFVSTTPETKILPVDTVNDSEKE